MLMHEDDWKIHRARAPSPEPTAGCSVFACVAATALGFSVRPRSLAVGPPEPRVSRDTRSPGARGSAVARCSYCGKAAAGGSHRFSVALTTEHHALQHLPGQSGANA